MTEEMKEALIICVKYAFDEIDSEHQWVVKMKHIRELLVLGLDEKEYMDVVHAYGDDEDKLEAVNEWLESNKFA